MENKTNLKGEVQKSEKNPTNFHAIEYKSLNNHPENTQTLFKFDLSKPQPIYNLQNKPKHNLFVIKDSRNELCI